MQQPGGRAGYPAFAGSVSSRGVPTIFSFWNIAGPFSPLVRPAGDTGQARGKRGSRLYKTQMGVVFVLGGLSCHLPGRRPERENVSGATVTLCVLFLYRRDPGGTRPYLWVGEPELVLSELESLKNVPLCLFYGDLRKISDDREGRKISEVSSEADSEASCYVIGRLLDKVVWSESGTHACTAPAANCCERRSSVQAISTALCPR